MNSISTFQIPQSLLRRTQFLPGESLASLLERLSQLNYLPYPRTLSRICCKQLQAPAGLDNLARPKWVETFLRLADLTHIFPEDLYAASDHRFAPFLTPPGQSPVELPWIGSTSKVMLTPGLAHGRLRSALSAQYCPRCLEDAAYHRLSWIPTAAAICLQHRCLLVNQCPQCQKRIAIQEIVRQRCRVCQADLSTAETFSVEGDELGLLSQQMIQSWLGLVADPPDQFDFPSDYPAVLYRFLENLLRRLLVCWKDWPNLSAPLDGLNGYITASGQHLTALTSGEIFHLCKAAFTGVMNWPDGLFQFLDAYCGYPFAQNSTVYVKRLEPVRQGWFQAEWQNPDFEFMQQGFVNYTVARNVPLPVRLVEQFKEVLWFVDATGLWSEEQAAQSLDIPVPGLRQFLPYGALEPCLWPRSRTSMPIFERDKILSLAQKWDLGWSVSEARSWLGLDVSVVTELVKRNVLTVVDRPDAEDVHWVLSRQSVENFSRKVLNRLQLFQGNHRDLVCLDEAAHITDDFGMYCVDLLLEVADGFLPAFKRYPEIEAAGYLCFLRDAVWDFPDLWYARRGWVLGYTFAKQKGFSHHLVLEWMDAGLITPVRVFGHYRYFICQELEQLAAKFSPI